jgi:hypothetical protein
MDGHYQVTFLVCEDGVGLGCNVVENHLTRDILYSVGAACKDAIELRAIRSVALTAVVSHLDMYCTNVLMYRMMVLLAHLTKVRC